MALQTAVSAVRASVLRHLRVVASPLQQQQPAMPSLSDVVVRAFGGGVLDREAVTQRVVHVAKHFDKVDTAKLSPTASFEKDLGLDSLDVVELVMALEEEFGIEIPDAEADKISSVQDAVNYVLSNPIAK